MRNTTRAGALGAAALTALLFALPSAGASDNAVVCPGRPAENVAAVAGALCGRHAPPPAGCLTCVELPVDHPCDQCTPDETTPPETTPETTPEVSTPEVTVPEDSTPATSTPEVTVEEPTATPVAVPIATPATSVVAVPSYTG